MGIAALNPSTDATKASAGGSKFRRSGFYKLLPQSFAGESQQTRAAFFIT
jgi:hypothetical protein